MKCNRCKNEIELSNNVKQKIELTGKDTLIMLCAQCKICSICYTDREGAKICCKSCGYYYHSEHFTSAWKEETQNSTNYRNFENKLKASKGSEESVCLKCMSLHSKTSFDTLLGPEIPALERYTEAIDKEISKKITEIIKKNKLSKNSDGIKKVFLGNVELTPLFSSPYPEEYIKHFSLYVCHGCLDYFSTEYIAKRHSKKCKVGYPPGRLLYLDIEGVAVFEVDGKEKPKYCQSLCLLAKMFLDHKTLYYDVEPFLFYVIGEVKENKFIMQGYFSKERGEGKNNLSCIVIFPPYRKLGLGSFLIDFSYYLTRETTQAPYMAGPEQPLSADGEKAYFTYWASCIVRYTELKKQFVPNNVCFEKISAMSGVSKDSIAWTCKELTKKYNKELTYLDFITHKDMVKKVRRMKEQYYLA